MQVGKIKPRDREEIVRLWKTGVSPAEIAERYDVTVQSIYRIYES